MTVTGGRRWIVAASVVVAIEYAAALTLGLVVGFPYHIPFETYVLVALTFGLAGSAGLLFVRLWSYGRRGVRHPIAELRNDDWSRLVTFLIGIALIGAQLAVLMWTKTMMPLVNGFWADPWLADADAALLGADAWTYTHRLPESVSTLLDRTYVTWAGVKFTTLILVLFAPASLRKGRLLLTYFLLVGSAALGQYLAASGGPIFYQLNGLGDRFAGLPIEPWAAATRDFLWLDYTLGGDKVGGGISAMPSLHVGVAAWCALCLQQYCPRLSFLGWIYAGLIMIGSVHLGWHYALDGLVALMLVALSWFVAGKIVGSARN